MIFKAIMRYFAYLFHTVLALFLIAISALAMSGAGSLKMGMLPWSGDTLNYVLLFGSLVGLATVLLALKGVLRILFLIWSFLIFVVIMKTYFISMYAFRPSEFRLAVYLAIGALLSVIGAWFGLRTDARPKKY